MNYRVLGRIGMLKPVIHKSCAGLAVCAHAWMHERRQGTVQYC